MSTLNRAPGGVTIRTLHIGLRVSDRHRSLAFYTALGYEVVGSVPATGFGHLTMLKLPQDEFVTIELVSDPPAERVGKGPGLHHLVINVESVDATVREIASRGIDADESTAPQNSDDIPAPDGSPIPTVTGSSWCSGPPATRTG